MMNFMDAMTNLFIGKRMVRQIWSGFYIIILPGQSYIWSVGSSNSQLAPNVTGYSASMDDILAVDWMVKVN